MRILIAEDERDLNRLIKKRLKENGYSVDACFDGEEVLDYLQCAEYDALILDIMMPKKDGIAVLQRLRERENAIPVLLLTAKDSIEDRVTGLDAGADDYLVKPFELEVLYSRICALLRRAGQAGGSYLVCGPVSMDKNQMKVFLNKEEISLGSLEYQLLAALLEHKNHTLTRQKLLELLWDANGNFVNDNTLTVAMKRLREKLSNPACIKTVRGFGYRMEDVEE